MREAWRLAVGTLTAVPVRPPLHVDQRTAALAMVLAPVAVLPLAGVVAMVVWAGGRGAATPLGCAVLAVSALAMGTRALHLDGLADTADGLTASYDRDRSLAVMRSGSAGPAGVVAIVLVLTAQVGALASLVVTDHGWLVAGVLVCASRAVLAALCTRGVPAARVDGLGSTFIGAVPRWAAGLVVLVAAVGCAAVAGPSGLAAIALASVLAGAVLRRALVRLGGLTGDVLGAAVELTLTVLLLGVS